MIANLIRWSIGNRFLVLLTAAMLPGREIAGYWKSVAATFFGVVYVAVPLSLLVWVCLQKVF